jgi:AMP nucleosidase
MKRSAQRRVERQLQAIAENDGGHCSICRKEFPHNSRTYGGLTDGGIVALAGEVTGARGEALKRRLRTGTVVSYDDRNWELRWSQERRRINLSRAIAVDMESGTLATQGYRLRVPYGTLLCVSDKPLHGEIKLPGAASAFYQRAVGEHLQIGLTALDILRDQLGTLHSRKLRSFDEPPCR